MRANLERANLKWTNFEEANLKWTNLKGANLIEVYVLSIDQLSKVKALYGTKLDEELMVQN